MTKSVITGRRHHTMGHVESVMAKHGIQSVPVVDDEGRVVGIVTETDIFRTFVSMLQ